MERCKGYALKNNQWMPPVSLLTPEAVWNWATLHKMWANELRVVHDADETICFHVVNGRLVYPTAEEGMSPEAIALFTDVETST